MSKAETILQETKEILAKISIISSLAGEITRGCVFETIEKQIDVERQLHHVEANFSYLARAANDDEEDEDQD